MSWGGGDFQRNFSFRGYCVRLTTEQSGEVGSTITNESRKWKLRVIIDIS
jgi:hypothetical protein